MKILCFYANKSTKFKKKGSMKIKVNGKHIRVKNKNTYSNKIKVDSKYMEALIYIIIIASLY